MALTVFKQHRKLAQTLLSVKFQLNVIRSILQVVELAKLLVIAPTNVTQRLLRPHVKVPTVYKPTLPVAPNGLDVNRRNLAHRETAPKPVALPRLASGTPLVIGPQNSAHHLALTQPVTVAAVFKLTLLLALPILNANQSNPATSTTAPRMAAEIRNV